MPPMCWDSKKAEKYCILYNIFQKKRFIFFFPMREGKIGLNPIKIKIKMEEVMMLWRKFESIEVRFIFFIRLKAKYSIIPMG